MGRHTARRASFPAALVSAARRGTPGPAPPRPGVAAPSGPAPPSRPSRSPRAPPRRPSPTGRRRPPRRTRAARRPPTPRRPAPPWPRGPRRARRPRDRRPGDRGGGERRARPGPVPHRRGRRVAHARAGGPDRGRAHAPQRGRDRGVRARGRGAPRLPAGPGLASPDDATASAEAADAPPTDDALTAAETLGASVPALDGRGDDRASRSSARTPLDELGPPSRRSTPRRRTSPRRPTTPRPGRTRVTPSADADAATESPEEDAAAADTATDAPDLGTGAPADAPAEDTPDADEAPAAPVGTGGTEEIAALTAELTTLLDAAGSGVTVQVVPGPPSPEEVAAQLDQWATSTAGFGNGQIPASALCELSFAPGSSSAATPPTRSRPSTRSSARRSARTSP